MNKIYSTSDTHDVKKVVLYTDINGFLCMDPECSINVDGKVVFDLYMKGMLMIHQPDPEVQYLTPVSAMPSPPIDDDNNIAVWVIAYNMTGGRERFKTHECREFE